MNYSKIRKFDVSNGPNIRTTLFVTGCTNGCEGCFNKELQDFNSGEPWTKEVEDLFIDYTKGNNIYGVNILGGEPMDQTGDEALPKLLERIKKETKKSIWLWSGYLFEQILEDEKKLEILKWVDVLVDGRFMVDKRDLNLKYRGSSNQRVIDVKRSFLEDKVVLVEIDK